MSNVEFKPWDKIPRENPFKATITEKINGTNACVIIQDGVVVGAQSRKRLITPEDDNYGFAAWVELNKEALETMGDGYHYGEWAGLGIQKNPHCLDRKRFFFSYSIPSDGIRRTLIVLSAAMLSPSCLKAYLRVTPFRIY